MLKIFQRFYLFIYLFVSSRPFEYLVLFTIFCNCAALALSKPLPNNDTTPTNSILVNN
jgi:hypothetical protein